MLPTNALFLSDDHDVSRLTGQLTVTYCHVRLLWHVHLEVLEHVDGTKEVTDDQRCVVVLAHGDTLTGTDRRVHYRLIDGSSPTGAGVVELVGPRKRSLHGRGAEPIDWTLVSVPTKPLCGLPVTDDRVVESRANSLEHDRWKRILRGQSASPRLPPLGPREGA